MISTSTRRFARMLLAFAASLAAASCSSGAPGSSDPVEPDEPGTIRGELAIYIATHDDGTSDTRYFLRSPSGEERHLIFHTEQDLDPGVELKIWGTQLADEIDVSAFKVLPPREDLSSNGLGSVSEPLKNVTPIPSRKMCIFLVDLGGGLGSLTADVVNQSFFTGAKSVDAFYRENSYGKQGLDGKVLGPYPYTMTACGNSDVSNMAKAMQAKLAGETCDQYAYVFGRTNLCAWGGLGSVGTPTKPARDTWYNGAVSCVVAVQEPGHNYGMAHSSSMTCPGAIFADNPTTAKCTHSEYGDKFDPMGGACRHMNVWQKNYEQWFGKCNGVKVTQSGTFNLLPTEAACDGIQALQIPMPAPRSFVRPAGGGGAAGTDTLTSYYLEYRTSLGFDMGMTPTVLLHVGGDYRPQTKAGLHTWLLDMHPGTGNASTGFNDAGFKVGESFTDPAPGGGVTITVEAMDATKATIKVDIMGGTGDPTCLNGTTIAAPGPVDCDGIVGEGDGGAVSTTDSGTSKSDAGDAGGRDAARSAEAGHVVDAAAESSASNTGSAGGPGNTEGAPVDAGNVKHTPDSATLAMEQPAVSDVQGGCACRMTTSPQEGLADGVRSALALGLAGLVVSRRRAKTAAPKTSRTS